MKNSICKHCTHYTAYYKQWSDGFSQLTNGFCTKCQTHKKQNETCEIFLSNELKEKRREKRRMESLDQALTSIIEIAAILKEKQNDT